jgi:hypothetical protein
MEAGQHSQVLYSMFPFGDTPPAASLIAEHAVEAIDPLPLYGLPSSSDFAMQQNTREFHDERIRWRTFRHKVV